MALRIGFKIPRYLGQNKFSPLLQQSARATGSRPGRALEGRLSRSSTQNALTLPLRLPRLASPFPERLKAFPSDTLADDAKAQLMLTEARDRRAAAPAPRAGRRFTSTSGQQQQRRLYSWDAATPAALSDLEQCEATLRRLRAQFPECRALRRPVAVAPGSQEERAFVRATLRLVARHKAAVGNRAPAPVPSYSEVKTFVREPCARRQYSTGSEAAIAMGSRAVVEKGSRAVLAKGSRAGLTQGSRAVLAKGSRAVLAQGSRAVLASETAGSQTAMPSLARAAFSTRSKACKPDKKKTEPVCRTLRSPGCAEPWPAKCAHVHEPARCRKLNAPYPSYSECMGDVYEPEMSECRECPWRHPPDVPFTQGPCDPGKKFYSTSSTTSSTVLAPKPKPPCESPDRDKQPCDYEGTARRHDELRHRRRPLPPPAGSSKRPGAKRDESRKGYSTVAASETIGNTVGDRLRDWLRWGRTESGCVRVTRAADVTDGRETYIIEIQDERGPWAGSETGAKAWRGLDEALNSLGPQDANRTETPWNQGPRASLEQVNQVARAARASLEQMNQVPRAARASSEQANQATGSDQVRQVNQTAKISSDQVYQSTSGSQAAKASLEPGHQVNQTAKISSAQVYQPTSGNQAARASLEQENQTAKISSEQLHQSTSGNQAELHCADSHKKPGKLPGGGCPPVKKKKEVVGDEKQKCRQRKKRKLPSCHDVGKDRTSKKSAAPADQLVQHTQEMAALHEPFKLRPQFWRM